MASSLETDSRRFTRSPRAPGHPGAGAVDYMVGGTGRRRRCGAPAALTGRSRSGLGCCATSPRSTPRPPSSAARCACPLMLAPIGSIETFTPGARPPPPRPRPSSGCRRCCRGLQPRPGSDRGRRRQLSHLPAVRARRRRLRVQAMCAAPSTTATPPSASPWTARGTAARARPRPALRQAVAPAPPAWTTRPPVVGHGQALQGPPRGAADPQGHRHRRGRRDGLRPRGRGRVRVEPRRAPARPRARHHGVLPEVVSAVAGAGDHRRGRGLPPAPMWSRRSRRERTRSDWGAACFGLAAAGAPGMVRALELLEEGCGSSSGCSA